MMEKQTEEAPSLLNTEEESCAKDKVWCLQRVGRDCDWLHLSEDSEVLVCLYLSLYAHIQIS